MTTRAEFIGAGPLWDGNYEPRLHVEHPPPFHRGLAMGQHLAVERLVRIAEDRMIYLVNNLGRKWKRKKCWACGNKYSPDKARHCTYCGKPLEDVRFLMTARWNKELFVGFEAFARTRTRNAGLIPPVYAFYRNGMMMAVYHYDGGAMLVDMVAPMPGRVLLAMASRLADTLTFLHSNGVVLGRFGTHNVILMPDLTARWFDLDVQRIESDPAALHRDPAQPTATDVKKLARMIGRFVSPDDQALAAFFLGAAKGRYSAPAAFADAARHLLAERMASNASPRNATFAAAYSDVGLRRAVNEDTWTWRRINDRAVLYVIADGMGGHAWGDVAAAMAADAVTDVIAADLNIAKINTDAIRELMSDGMMKANEVVFTKRRAERVDMGTTLTALLVIDDRYVFITHSGDSRAYLLRKGKLKQITRDHTVAAALVEDGQIKPEEAKNHKSAHILTNTVGGEEELEFDFHQLQAEPGDRFLLCSDGLYNEVEDVEMSRHLGLWADRQKSVRELVRAAYHYGGSDNVTALVLDIV